MTDFAADLAQEALFVDDLLWVSTPGEGPALAAVGWHLHEGIEMAVLGRDPREPEQAVVHFRGGDYDSDGVLDGIVFSISEEGLRELAANLLAYANHLRVAA